MNRRPPAVASTTESGVDPGPPIVEVDHLSIRFPVGRTGFWGREKQHVHAVDDITFDIRPGETLGLVGESGSGKSTTGRAILRRVDATEGTIRFRGEDITQRKGEQLRTLRRDMQLVFQDPYASLNPRLSVAEIVAEPLLVHGLISKVSEARDKGPDSREAIDAIQFMNRVWTTFVEDLGNPDNELPKELRANLISIGLWLLREAEEVRQGRSQNFDGLIEVSQIIRDGMQ